MHFPDLSVGGTEMLSKQRKLRRKEKKNKLKVNKYLPDTTGTENKDL